MTHIKIHPPHILPQAVANAIEQGKQVTYNVGPRLVTAKRVRHLIVFQAAQAAPAKKVA